MAKTLRKAPPSKYNTSVHHDFSEIMDALRMWYALTSSVVGSSDKEAGEKAWERLHVLLNQFKARLYE